MNGNRGPYDGVDSGGGARWHMDCIACFETALETFMISPASIPAVRDETPGRPDDPPDPPHVPDPPRPGDPIPQPPEEPPHPPPEPGDPPPPPEGPPDTPPGTPVPPRRYRGAGIDRRDAGFMGPH